MKYYLRKYWHGEIRKVDDISATSFYQRPPRATLVRERSHQQYPTVQRLAERLDIPEYGFHETRISLGRQVLRLKRAYKRQLEQFNVVVR